jgi:hypothetical protein
LYKICLISSTSIINVRVYGINYAGRADKTDFVQKLSLWADASELGYHLICDDIFVGSNDHKENVCEYFQLNTATVHVTGYVWDLNYMNSFHEEIGEIEKKKILLFGLTGGVMKKVLTNSCSLQIVQIKKL